MKITIIWWTWAFGQFWYKYFMQKWYEVIPTSNNTETKPKEAILMSDIIIFSVSIRNTIPVMQNLIPLIPAWKLVMDFTGIKTEASAELRKYTT